MRKRLGCLSTSGIVAAILTVVAIAVAGLVWGGQPFSPGPLNAQAGQAPLGGVASHADIGGDCAACHPAPWSPTTVSDRCLECHTAIEDELASQSGMHGALYAQDRARPCYQCHPEHNGAEASLTRIDTEDFPHTAVGYSLQEHVQMADGRSFTCQDCHNQSLSAFDPTVCAGCHQDLDAGFMDAHTAAFGSGCLGCHDGTGALGAAFDHNRLAFALEGQHAQVACVACHPGARSLADLRAAPQECVGCHEADDAHDGEFGQDCGQCHTPDVWEAATFDHGMTGFSLTGAHVEVDCGECHVDGVYQGTAQDCFACHEADDAHDGEFGQDCGQCHTPDSWEDATFDHSLTGFSLTGAHVQVDCSECHIGGVYQGTPQDCVACHEADDAHDGAFGRDCGQCHTPDSWEDATFDHSLTGFALTGAHVEVDCGECHLDGVYQGTPQDCVACHQDPDYHAGLFGADCAGCHTTTAWSPASYDRRHDFPIDHGEGGPSSCQTCHPDTLVAYTCYGCHEHNQLEIAAKHREEGIRDFEDCVRCHPTGRKEEGAGGDD